MKIHSYLQRRVNAESSDPLIVKTQAHPSNPQHEQPQTHDFSHVDLFSNAPQRAPIQMKLTVGAPNDVYEQEADRVADQVLSMPDSATQQPIQREADSDADDDDLQMKPLSAKDTPLVQREIAPEEEEPEPVQAKLIQREMALEEEEPEPVQAKLIQREAMPQEELMQMKQSSTPQAPHSTSSLASQLSSSQGNGSPLPDDVRTFMEPRFGADFSSVRVHTGAEAVQMNQDLSAQAFTHKQDIFFGAGKSPSNDVLTAHELTHVVQQNGAITPKHGDSENAKK